MRHASLIKNADKSLGILKLTHWSGECLEDQTPSGVHMSIGI